MKMVFSGVRCLLRGLALLRHPEVIQHLGERRLQLQAINHIRRRFPSCTVSSGVEMTEYEDDRFQLGEGAGVCHGTVLAFGDSLNGCGRIQLGDRSWIGQYNNLRACDGGDIIVGKGCLISQFCTLVGSNHAMKRSIAIMEQGPDLRRLGVVVGDDVWLGAGVTVLPGVCIGDGAVVGANSVVSRSIPSFEIWAGSPAVRVGVRA
jgi:acetyltransferase-like isoleucine patch superfamily enzyme